MSALRPGSVPVLSSCALAALTVLSGCASTGTAPHTAQNVSGPRVAQAAAVTEDDGLPVQSPPQARIRAMPDNPSEPFSKNYGGSNPAALSAGGAPREENAAAGSAGKAPARKPALPDDLPPAFRQKLVTALSQED